MYQSRPCLILLVWTRVRWTLAPCSSSDSERNRCQVEGSADGQSFPNRRRSSTSVDAIKKRLCIWSTPYCAQSSGGVWKPHTLPGSSSASPSSQTFSYSPIGMQFTTRAVTVVLAGRPSNRTADPIASGRWKRAADPCGFTRSVIHGSENG